MKSIRTNDSLAQPYGSSGPRMTIQKHPKLGPGGLAFNLPHCSVLKCGSPQQPKESLKGLRAEAVSSKHSQEIGQQVFYWRRNLAVYHNIHHRPLLKLSIRLLSIQIRIILPTCLELYCHIHALKITLWPRLLPHPLPKRKIIL